MGTTLYSPSERESTAAQTSRHPLYHRFPLDDLRDFAFALPTQISVTRTLGGEFTMKYDGRDYWEARSLPQPSSFDID